MVAYIKGAVAISPQMTFGIDGLPNEIVSYPDADYLRCIDPAYKDYIDPMVARRMSRIVKMGVCGAIECIRKTNMNMPDGIITGTGLGCLEDTEKFLASIYNNDEKLLNPTPFIQSTHNTVAGAIALAIKCNNYNATYTHRGFSFESAIQDALLQLNENPSLNILTGGFDEITETSYNITRRLGLSKNNAFTENNNRKTRGSVAGEGVAFFMLSGKKSKDDFAGLKLQKTFYKPGDKESVADLLNNYLKNEGVDLSKVNLLLPGISGDYKTDKIYYDLINGVFNNIPYLPFKQICGEYDTSSSFALWMASMILKNQFIPGYLNIKAGNVKNIERILIYNHLRGNNHSLYLLERC